LGLIAPGKIADLTLVDGDPLKLIFNLMNVSAVVQGGTLVVDKR
jgi:imidazolonepropionase-like amidohydrolase